MDIKDCFKIGYVAKTHGLKGGVVVSTMPECPDLEGMESIFLTSGNSLVPYFFEDVSVRGDKAFVKFQDVDTIEAATALKGSSLYIPKNERPRPVRGEFYDDEVNGFEVIEDDKVLGTVIGVMTAGPNRFIELIHDGREVLIPVNGPFIKSINRSRKRITVELPEGFLDI